MTDRCFENTLPDFDGIAEGKGAFEWNAASSAIGSHVQALLTSLSPPIGSNVLSELDGTDIYAGALPIIQAIGS